MLFKLIYKELLDHLLSLRFAIACILCFIVILTSLYVRCGDYAQKLNDFHENVAVEANRRRNINRPWQLEREGVQVHQPPPPLSVFVQGAGDTGNVTAQVNTRDEPQLISSDEQNPTSLLFPAMDIVSFVGIIMSLLAIVFGYDAISGEKERGTLRLVLSYSVPRDTVLLGKWIGGYIALAVPFLLAIVSGAAITLVQPNVSLTFGDWGRLGLMSVLSLVYIAVMFAASVWVSCLTQRSSTSVMILVTVWMVLVLAVPNISPYLAQAWLPPPNPAEIDKAKEEKRAEIQKEVDAKMEEYDRANFAAGTPWHRQVDWRDAESRKIGLRRWRQNLVIERDASQRRIRAIDQINTEYANRMAVQATLGRWISRLSPFSCFAAATAELTGTGASGRQRFVRLLREYQQKLAVHATDEQLAQLDRELETGERQGRGGPPRGRITEVPAFSYQAPATGEYLAAAAVDTVMLIAAVVVFLMLSYTAFLRYDVR